MAKKIDKVVLGFVMARGPFLQLATGVWKACPGLLEAGFSLLETTDEAAWWTRRQAMLVAPLAELHKAGVLPVAHTAEVERGSRKVLALFRNGARVDRLDVPGRTLLPQAQVAKAWMDKVPPPPRPQRPNGRVVDIVSREHAFRLSCQGMRVVGC